MNDKTYHLIRFFIYERLPVVMIVSDHEKGYWIDHIMKSPTALFRNDMVLYKKFFDIEVIDSSTSIEELIEIGMLEIL